MPQTQSKLLLAHDLAGTVVMAVEGAAQAMAHGLDVFGVLVLSFVTALGGGLIRDVVIGATPPAALRDWRYPVTALVAGGAAFPLHASVAAIPPTLLLTLDAAGLALFAVAGTEKALAFGLNAVAAVLLGTLTGIGGGVVRDVLLAEIPSVLRVDVYATAAVAGSAVMVASLRLGLALATATRLGGAACFGLRMVAVALHWNLPRLVA